METAREWFKKKWEGDYPDDNFEEDFSKTSEEWFEAFKKYYEAFSISPEFIQHPKYIMEDEAFKTISWNASWIHADLFTKNIK